VAREDDAADAGALCATEERAEVAGVGDACGDEQERRGAGLGGAAEFFEGDRLEGAGERDDALGGVGAGLGIESGAGDRLDGNPALGGQLLNLVELGRRVLVLGQQDAADAATPRSEELEDGATTFDLVPAELPQRRARRAATTGGGGGIVTAAPTTGGWGGTAGPASGATP
jgi:hypothetical protein